MVGGGGGGTAVGEGEIGGGTAVGEGEIGGGTAVGEGEISVMVEVGNGGDDVVVVDVVVVVGDEIGARSSLSMLALLLRSTLVVGCSVFSDMMIF